MGTFLCLLPQLDFKLTSWNSNTSYSGFTRHKDQSRCQSDAPKENDKNRSLDCCERSTEPCAESRVCHQDARCRSLAPTTSPEVPHPASVGKIWWQQGRRGEFDNPHWLPHHKLICVPLNYCNPSSTILIQSHILIYACLRFEIEYIYNGGSPKLSKYQRG